MKNDTIITEIEKSENRKIIITDTEFRKNNIVDIREYYLDEKDNNYKPTKRGIQITYDKLENFVLPLYKYYKDIIELSKLKDGQKIIDKLTDE